LKITKKKILLVLIIFGIIYYFFRPAYNVNIKIIGKGKVIPKSGEYKLGSYNFKAIPVSEGVIFDHWEGEGIERSNDEIFKVYVNKNIELTAVFGKPIVFRDDDLKEAIIQTNFRNKFYTDNILEKEAKKIEVVSIKDQNISSLDGIQYFNNLRKINYYEDWSINNSNGISDLTPLIKLNKLEVLNLEENNISNIKPLTKLKQLKELNLSSNYIEDFSPFEEMISLKRLDLSNTKLKNINSLSNLKKMEELDLSINSIENISDLKGLHNLKKLDLSNNEITDINSLSNLRKLEELDLEYTKINDITPLRNLDNLKELNIENTDNLNITNNIKLIIELQEKGVAVKYKDTKYTNNSSYNVKSNSDPGEKPENSLWDGSVYEVKTFLENHLKDPDSVEYIDWYKPSLKEHNGDEYWGVKVKYRAKNSFGGYVVNTQLFLIKDGNVVTYLDY